MKLISRMPGARIWRLENGAHIEQRAMLYIRNFEMSATIHDAYPEVAEKAAEMAVASTTAGVHELGEPFTSGEIYTNRFTVVPVLLDENDSPIMDDDGEATPDPEGIPFEVVRLTVEFGYWPKIEEES